MASLAARWPSSCRIWRSVGGALSSRMLPCRKYSANALNRRLRVSPEVSLAVDALAGTYLTREIPSATLKMKTIGAKISVYNRNAYLLKMWEGFRVYPISRGVPFTNLEPQLSRRAHNEDVAPLGKYVPPARDAPENSRQDSTRQGFFCEKELRIGSASGVGSMGLSSATSEPIAVLKQGLYVDSYMLVEVLKRCSKQKDLVAARQLHECILQSGMDKNSYVMNTLLNVYIKCGRLQDARRVFDELETKDVVTWRIMIAGYAENDHAGDAMEILNRMRQAGAQPNEVTCLTVLKACGSPVALQWGKQLHAYIRHAGLESNVRVGTALVQMYAKCGSLMEARRVFQTLTNRDVITWNVMIGACAESGIGEEAYQLFLEMKREGFIPDAVTYLSILNAAASAGSLNWVREVHDHARSQGLDSHLRVGNALVHMYAKSGSIDAARVVFDRMEERDAVTWNAMIGAYAESGCGVKAYQFFLQMKQEGFIPDAITYMCIFNASASAGALDWVREVHAHARADGLEADLRVGNALVHMYAKSGSIGDAREVFETMKQRDVTTWNIMIGAYAESGCGVETWRLFLRMKSEGFVPDAITYLSMVNASVSPGALEWVREVHGNAQRDGLESDLGVGNALAQMYAKSGSMEDARLVFGRMEERDVVTWTIMIGGYAECGRGLEAYQLFLEMEREGFKADAITYVSILNASASAGALEWVREVHKHACRAGLDSDLRVSNALVHMYANSGSMDEAVVVFEGMQKRDVTTWATMIGAYAESGCGLEAYRLFLQMNKQGFIPNAITYISILNAAASTGALGWVKEVHEHARREGLEADLRVGNALVHMYSKCGSMDDARLVFSTMDKRDVVTWNTMIGACAESGGGVEAHELFLQMEEEGITRDAITYMSILNASSSAGALEWVREVHGHAVRAGLELDLCVGNALVHMYAKIGSIDDARRIFHRLQKRDIVSWNTMLGGLAQHGCGHEALELFRSMNADCVKPDESTFVALLSACCHAGLLDDGRRLLLAMKQDFGIEPTVMHYTCMVDLLGRAGHLEEAHRLIGDLPVEPDGVTWKSLLGACRTYGNVELGELAAKEVLKLEPKDSAGYVLLSNIYAAAGMWEKASSVRNMMQERGVWKEPGRSWIEVGNKIHEFVVGDTSHPESKAIYAELMKLTEKLKAEGYIPDTQLVLRNIDEEEKELALCSHSEKLAIAYGLMHIPHEKPIRIYKNLRVCSDCHTATRFISKVTGREIIARDSSRFHHFKDGMCSCGDYW